jgi:hypothetical protein
MTLSLLRLSVTDDAHSSKYLARFNKLLVIPFQISREHDDSLAFIIIAPSNKFQSRFVT